MDTTTRRQPRGAPTGGQFAATPHAEPSVELTPAQVPLGSFAVPAASLDLARNVESAIAHQWQTADAARIWAETNGFEHETCSDYTSADSAHMPGAVLVSEFGISIAVSGAGLRNFSVDIEDGEGDTLDTGDDDGRIETVTFIHPRSPANPTSAQENP